MEIWVLMTLIGGGGFAENEIVVDSGVVLGGDGCVGVHRVESGEPSGVP